MESKRATRPTMLAINLIHHLDERGRGLKQVFAAQRRRTTRRSLRLDARLRAFPPQAVLGPCFSTGRRWRSGDMSRRIPVPPAAASGGGRDRDATCTPLPTRRKRRA